MCGRFIQSRDAHLPKTTFVLNEVPTDLRPRYNLAPTQPVGIVGLKPDGQTRGMVMVRWGFVPHFEEDPKRVPLHINAKSETVADKWTFRDSFRSKRCLIPAEGFYEWLPEAGRKRPYLFRPKAGGLMAFAGLWDVWTGQGHPPFRSALILTRVANEVVAPFHDRMPLVLPPDQWDTWMRPTTPLADLMPLLNSAVEPLEVVRVGFAVNKVANDGPECVAPVAQS